MNGTHRDQAIEIRMKPDEIENIVSSDINIFEAAGIIYRYVFRSIPNIRLIVVDVDPWDLYSAFTNDNITVWPRSIMYHLLKEEIQQAHFTQAYDFSSDYIYSCVDEQLEETHVLMYRGALGTIIWATIILCLLAISLVTAVAFTARISNNRKASRLAIEFTKKFWDTCFIYFSHLLWNSIEGSNRLHLSSRFILSGWLLGACVVLNRYYLANMKGELATVKIAYIDTIQQLLANPNIKHIYAYKERYMGIQNEHLTPEEIEILLRVEPIGDEENCPVTSQSVLFSSSGYFHISQKICHPKLCKNIYQGRNQFLAVERLLSLSPRLPSSLRETVDYRVLRYVETRQIRPNDIKIEFDNFDDLHIENSQDRLQKTSWQFLAPVIKTWFCGILLSIVVIVIEFVKHHHPLICVVIINFFKCVLHNSGRFYADNLAYFLRAGPVALLIRHNNDMHLQQMKK